MADGPAKIYMGGFLAGAGLALFALYVLSQIVPFTLEQWPRIAVGVVGLALLVVGFWLRPRPSK
jgi:hypothetical protein